MGELDFNTTRENPKDQLDRLVNSDPQQVFARSLQLAVIMHHYFWSSEKESENDVDSSEELHLRYKLLEMKMHTVELPKS